MLLLNTPSIDTRQEILSRVDEYTLYCYYLDQEIILGRPIVSPIRRGDESPSFVVFTAMRGKGLNGFEYSWKDHGAGGQSGNIFKLIQILKGLVSFEDVYALINKDFELGLGLKDIEVTEKISLYSKPTQVEAKIRIKSCSYSSGGKQFWDRLRIDEELLKYFHASQISMYWSYPNQRDPKVVKDPTFAYEIGGYYQIYSPYAPKKDKFRNDLPDNYFFGYLQLPRNGDLLIIDKSMKDLIFDRRLDYFAVAGKSESIMIPAPKMWELKERFKRIVLMQDPDEAGMIQTEKYLAEYPWLEAKFLTMAKDKTDLCNLVGFDETKKILNELLL
jgi:hypothetical protein